MSSQTPEILSVVAKFWYFKCHSTLLDWDRNTERLKWTLIYFNTDTVCTFSGKCPLSSHKTTLKQQINGQKRWKMKEKDLSRFVLVFTACSVLGRLLAWQWRVIGVLRKRRSCKVWDVHDFNSKPTALAKYWPLSLKKTLAECFGLGSLFLGMPHKQLSK